MGNTGYFVATDDFFLLGVLSSWTTWFVISKTAQPLRLRGDRWQYRLFSQFMELLPVPDAGTAEREHIARLAKLCHSVAPRRYNIRNSFRMRLVSSLAKTSNGLPIGKLNNKATDWWELTFKQLGAALKTSFKLKSNPFTNPRTADEWEPYFNEKKAEVDQLSRQLADAEAELNDRVYRLFKLTPEEIQLLQREVEH
jgi:hypothetical protein